VALFKSTSRSCRVILIGIVYITMLQSSMLMAASSELDGFEAGVEAFHRGDFTAARGSIAPFTGHPEKRLPAQAYIFAMQDEKVADPSLAPSEELKAFIVAQGTTYPLYKALSAKLHLMGYHPESNPERGLSDLGGLGEVDGSIRPYALYTLGLYHEGLFTVPPSPNTSLGLERAKLKYAEAHAIGHRAAMERYQILNPELEGGWEAEGDYVSQLVNSLGGMLYLSPISVGQGAGGGRGTGKTSAPPSMLSHKTGRRFYGEASFASSISANSYTPQPAGEAQSRYAPPRVDPEASSEEWGANTWQIALLQDALAAARAAPSI
jgi:hypothetical protein